MSLSLKIVNKVLIAVRNLIHKKLILRDEPEDTFNDIVCV